MSDAETKRHEAAKLVALRRLYHHVSNGGKTNERDDLTVGKTATKENISSAIKGLENKLAPGLAPD